MRHKSKKLMDSIVAYVDSYHRKNRCFPTTGEIATSLGVVKSTVYKYLVAMNEDGVVEYDGRRIVTDSIRRGYGGDTVDMKVLGGIACGTPQAEQEYTEDTVSLPSALFGTGDFFMLHAKGDSMTEGGIDSGDLVVIRRQEHAEEGQIIAALVGEEKESTLKRFFVDKKNKRIRLHPENPAMEDIYTKDCIIQGVAVHVIKRLE